MTDIVLPPVCYDLLERSITTHGIGAGRYYTFSPHTTGAGGDWIPCCLVGHFEELFGDYNDPGRRLLGIGEGASDRAVRKVNAAKRPHRHVDSRITWSEYRDELSLLKGVTPHDFTQGKVSREEVQEAMERVIEEHRPALDWLADH